jgi:hypothetical protein
VQEFGITKKKFNEFKGALRGGKHALRVARVDMVYNEAAVLQRTIEFGGREFTINALATADLEWDLWRLGYEYDFVKNDHGLFGLIAEVDFNHVVADLRATTGLNRVASLTDENVPTPGFGLIGRGYVHRNVSITAEFTGFKLPGFLADKLSDLAEKQSGDSMPRCGTSTSTSPAASRAIRHPGRLPLALGRPRSTATLATCQ